MRPMLAALLIAALTPVTSTGNPYRFDERVPLKENPDWGDRGFMHREYHQEFTGWHNKAGIHCCGVDAVHGDGDCRATLAEFNYEVGKWEALVDGEWRFIEADRHITNVSVLPFAVVCAGPYGTIYCFKPEASLF